jgi:cytochrome P450
MLLIMPEPVAPPEDLAIDPIDPDFYAAPRRAIEWLQSRAPAYLYDPRPRYHSPAWIVSRHEDVYRALGDVETYSTTDPLHEVQFHFEPAGYAASDFDPRLQRSATPQISEGRAHTRLRRLVPLKPRVIRQMEPRLREIVREVVAGIPPGQECDFTDLVANRVPQLVVCELLGLAPEQGDQTPRWGRSMFASARPDGVADPDSMREMLDVLDGVIQAHRESPRDDLVSGLLEAEWQGERLDDDEIRMWCWALMLGGQDTTASSLANGMQGLLEHPRQVDRLLADLSLIPNAVEEQLRWSTAIRYFNRTLRKDVTIGGVEVPAGSVVFLSLLAANFDATVFSRPFEFDVGRSFETPHVAFGYGPHFCIGATLARVEMRLVLEELARRFSRWERVRPAEPRTTGMSIVINEPARIPVRFSV